MISSSSEWVFISGLAADGRQTHPGRTDHQSNSSFAAPPNMRSSAKVIGRGCVDLHAGIARPSLDVTAHPSWRQIVVTWWKSISGSGSGLMTFDGIYCYLRLLLLLSILVSMFWPGQKVKSGHHYFRVFYHQRGKNSLFWPLKGLLFKRCQRCSKHFENLILTEPLTAESSDNSVYESCTEI